MLFSRSMRVLELTGEVLANEFRDYDGEEEGLDGPMIGGKYVIEEFRRVFGTSDLDDCTVLLAHGGTEDAYRGRAWASEGTPGYSSWTPAMAPDIWVGGPKPGDEGRYHDLIEKLTELDGQTVHLRIDDGPS